MTEIIKRIQADEFSAEIGSYWNTNFGGFVIETDKQRIMLGISEGQSCCEQSGYFLSEDDPGSFIGAELIGLKVTDTALKTYSEDTLPDVYEGGVMFVDIETSRGVLQFVAYNSHNGYYGHEAVVISTQLNHAKLCRVRSGLGEGKCTET